MQILRDRCFAGRPDCQKKPCVLHNYCDRVGYHHKRVESMDGLITPTKAAAPLVTLKSVFEQVGATHEMSKKQVDGFLVDFVAAMTAHLQSGTRIRMSGLGTLGVRQSAARTGRNPATGEPIQIKASNKMAFRPAKELKEAV